jgi:hypothetical protein
MAPHNLLGGQAVDVLADGADVADDAFPVGDADAAQALVNQDFQKGLGLETWGCREISRFVLK